MSVGTGSVSTMSVNTGSVGPGSVNTGSVGPGVLGVPVEAAAGRAEAAPGLFDRLTAGQAERARSPVTEPPRKAPAGEPSGVGRRARRPVPPVPQAARDLLADACRGLGRAIRATDSADRYAAAHLAALRAAAAVLAARARPVRGRRGSAWELIAKVAPEFSEWAVFFAAGSAKRQAAEAGLHRLVTAREADDMVRQVGAFLDLVEDTLASDTS